MSSTQGASAAGMHGGPAVRDRWRPADRSASPTEVYLAQFSKPLSPEVAGGAVVELVRADAASVSPGYLLAGEGLQELPWNSQALG
jgi:hypothetical protein